MSRDNLYLYIHFSNYNQAVFIEEWKDYAIPYNDIDTTRLFDETSTMFPHFLLDEEDGALPLNLTIFGAKVKNRLHARQVWSDLNIEAIGTKPDASILPPLHSRDSDLALAEFLANGLPSELSEADVLDYLANELANHTFNYKRSSGSYSMPVQTPRVAKTRQPSLEKFQTPITRIMR